MKTTYIRPLCETVSVQFESMMQSTSREAKAGTASPSNANSDHYNSDHYKDPTSPIDMMDGGESLSKGCYIWENLDDWV